MPVYHQMGFHSNNLVDLPEMSRYSGAIFSPINATHELMVDQISKVAESKGKNFQVIFDPQLYVPATLRGELKNWSYFPKDVDTADYSSHSWWSAMNSKLGQAAVSLRAHAVCSPTIIPKVFNDAFYSQSVQTAKDLAAKLKPHKIRPMQTILVNSVDLTTDARPYEIATIVSKTVCDHVYLVFVTSIEPRRELPATDELVGAMRLISLLEGAKLPVLVGFCSSDVLLWKAAGATACASGKFFNLRRFTRQRFEEPKATGGGQLPYWFEEGLLAFLREADLLLLRKHAMLSETSLRNPFGKEILQKLDRAKKSGKKEAWLGESWRHFLYWFADVEARLHAKEATAEELLKHADSNWGKLDQAKLLMTERPNDGSWIRAWLNVLREAAN